MVEASQVLLALQVAFFAASVALLLRRPPLQPLQPLPPPLPVSEPSGGAERKKKGKAKRQVELGHPTWVCLKIVYPYTQWLIIIIPTKWL